MLRVLLAALFGGMFATTSDVSGQDRQFPYSALVEVDGEYVRSGPGPKYYPTSKLKKGEKVTVHRHDPGGWYMIAPPSDSFSWIQAEHVQRTTPEKGVLMANNVIVRVGSAFSEDRDVFQRTLSKGDIVEILDQKTFPSDKGPVAMFKIRPPAHEFRWMAGKALVPSEAPPSGPIAGTTPGNGAPPTTPNTDPFSPSPGMQDLVARPPATRSPRPTPSTSPVPDAAMAAESQRLEQLRDRLKQLDKEFSKTIQNDPTKWRINQIEQGYREIASQTDHPEFAQQLKQRFSAVDRYTKLQQEYVELARLSQESRDRDAALMSLQPGALPLNQRPSGTGSPAIGSPNTTPLEQQQNQTSPPLSGTNPTTSPNAVPPAPTAPGQPAPARFSGAGILQSAAGIPGAPAFVLLSPEGRILAFAHPAPGIDLRPWLGHAVGVLGPRGFQPQLRADVIEVQSVQPVNLRPAPR